MSGAPLDVVTGATGYSGMYIANRLMDMGRAVMTLTGKPADRAGSGQLIRSAPFNFEDPDLLAASLEGVDTFYNTYWVRFRHGGVGHDDAVFNSFALIDAAERAGVRRFVQISITNPSEDSDLPYFRGKAMVEQYLRASGLSYAVIRPTVLFGMGDILINNIAWTLRHMPAFAIPGDGEYRLQPVYVDDMAEMAVAQGGGSDNVTLDAVGPDVFTFGELVRMVASAIKSRAIIFNLDPDITLGLARAIGYVQQDVLLTSDEVEGLMAGLLVSDAEPTCRTSLTDWVMSNAETLGVVYASELERRR